MSEGCFGEPYGNYWGGAFSSNRVHETVPPDVASLPRTNKGKAAQQSGITTLITGNLELFISIQKTSGFFHRNVFHGPA
jgi:hypothetical protein